MRFSKFKVQGAIFGLLLIGLAAFQNCSKVGFVPPSTSTASQSSSAGLPTSTVTPTAADYAWSQGAFGSCVGTCGTGAMTAQFTCADSNGAPAAAALCKVTRPNPITQSCALPACPVACSSQELVALYSSAKTSLAPSQSDLATSCVDPSTNLSQNFTIQGDAFATNRYIYTCASRWCSNHFNMAAIGMVTSPLAFDGSGSLVPGTTANIQCYNSQVAATPSSACATVVQNAPPIQSFQISYGAPGCGAPCGCNASDLSAALANNPGACGNSYCQANGFSWGILDEVGPSGGYQVTCSLTPQ